MYMHMGFISFFEYGGFKKKGEINEVGREERVRVNAWLVGADGSVVIGVDS